jgi:hypothetical protein
MPVRWPSSGVGVLVFIALAPLFVVRCTTGKRRA